MPTLNQNVLVNGKVVRAGKSISAATVKKLDLGDHLFDKEAKASAPASEENSDQENQED